MIIMMKSILLVSVVVALLLLVADSAAAATTGEIYDRLNEEAGYEEAGYEYYEYEYEAAALEEEGEYYGFPGDEQNTPVSELQTVALRSSNTHERSPNLPPRLPVLSQQEDNNQNNNKISASQNAAGAPSPFLPLDGPRFDFIVAGFPKCGTTTLLKLFGKHFDIDMADREQCAIASPEQADPAVHKQLDETLLTLDPSPHMKRAFRCYTTMYNYKSLVRMERHSPNAKFVVGMHHPVKMMQSFYNYRIFETKHFGFEGEEIPTLHEILQSGEPWKDVSLTSPRFDLFLMQMGKTNLTLEQKNDLIGQEPYEVFVKPTTFKVFIYTKDQLDDTNETRSTELRRVLQEFLELETPIGPFSMEQMNLLPRPPFKEVIDICDSEWATLRVQLVEQGQKTAMWLRDHFIHSPDVVLANPDHFLQTLEGWSVDPCQPEPSEEAYNKQEEPKAYESYKVEQEPMQILPMMVVQWKLFLSFVAGWLNRFLLP